MYPESSGRSNQIPISYFIPFVIVVWIAERNERDRFSYYHWIFETQCTYCNLNALGSVFFLSYCYFGIERVISKLLCNPKESYFWYFNIILKTCIYLVLLRAGEGNNCISEKMRGTIWNRFISLWLSSSSFTSSFDTIPELYPFHSKTAKSIATHWMSGGAWPVKFHPATAYKTCKLHPTKTMKGWLVVLVAKCSPYLRHLGGINNIYIASIYLFLFEQPIKSFYTFLRQIKSAFVDFYLKCVSRFKIQGFRLRLPFSSRSDSSGQQ